MGTVSAAASALVVALGRKEVGADLMPEFLLQYRVRIIEMERN